MSTRDKVTTDDFPVIHRLSKLAQLGYSQTSMTPKEFLSAFRMKNTGYLRLLRNNGPRVTFKFVERYQRKLDQDVANSEHLKAQNMLEKMNQERKSIARLELEGTMVNVPVAEKKAKPITTPASGDIALLIQELKTTNDAAQKRKIRAKLRRMGHTGGAR